MTKTVEILKNYDKERRNLEKLRQKQYDFYKTTKWTAFKMGLKMSPC